MTVCAFCARWRSGKHAVRWGHMMRDTPEKRFVGRLCALHPMLCKQGVVGSSPISSTLVTRALLIRRRFTSIPEPGLRVGCALAGLA